MNKTKIMGRTILFLLSIVALCSCSKAYYSTMEKFGYEKRDILINRVEDTRDEQMAAKKQFESSLAELSSLIDFNGGSLESKYNKVKREFERSESRAEKVRDRVDSVERVARDLFREWEAELGQYSNSSLRAKSRQKLDATKDSYAPLISAMKRAESKMDPVLSALRDQVLFLKHNLNAKAVASIKTELGVIESDVANLIRDMNSSIDEAEIFITAMK